MEELRQLVRVKAEFHKRRLIVIHTSRHRVGKPQFQRMAFDCERMEKKAAELTASGVNIQAYLQGCCALAVAKTFLEVQNENIEEIVLRGNNLIAAEQTVQMGTEVSQKGRYRGPQVAR